MTVINQTWLKLGENSVSSDIVNWAASIVLNKLQKSGKAKYHTVTF